MYPGVVGGAGVLPHIHACLLTPAAPATTGAADSGAGATAEEVLRLKTLIKGATDAGAYDKIPALAADLSSLYTEEMPAGSGRYARVKDPFAVSSNPVYLLVVELCEEANAAGARGRGRARAGAGERARA